MCPLGFTLCGPANKLTRSSSYCIPSQPRPAGQRDETKGQQMRQERFVFDSKDADSASHRGRV